MVKKKFRLRPEELKDLIKPIGSCYASDKITVEGLPVRWMYREEPRDEIDSGWRFFSGTEDQEYVDNPDNLAIYDVNTIANCDQTIIPYLHLPKGTQLEKPGESGFVIVEEE